MHDEGSKKSDQDEVNFFWAWHSKFYPYLCMKTSEVCDRITPNHYPVTCLKGSVVSVMAFCDRHTYASYRGRFFLYGKDGWGSNPRDV